MTIYLDVVLIENIIINFIIIFTTSLISKYKINYARLFLSSLLGSISVIGIYFINLHSIIEVIFKILVSTIMILVAFKFKNIKKYIKDILSFYLVTFTFGGVSFFLMYVINPVVKNGIIFGMYSLKKMCLGIIISFILITIVFKLTKSIFLNGKTKCKIKIFYRDKEIETIAIIDTRKYAKRSNNRLSCCNS